MPRIGPIHRHELIAYLRMLGFEGPHAGGRHQFMLKESARLVLPNPHHGAIGVELLSRILRQAGISRNEWERL